MRTRSLNITVTSLVSLSHVRATTHKYMHDAHVIAHTRAHKCRKTHIDAHALTQLAHTASTPSRAATPEEHRYSTSDGRGTPPPPPPPSPLRPLLRLPSSHLQSTLRKAIPSRRAPARRSGSPHLPLTLTPRVAARTCAMHHATPGGREMRGSENRLHNARRACTCCSDDSCAQSHHRFSMVENRPRRRANVCASILVTG